MIDVIDAPHPVDLQRFDAVIDVRSPSEFAEDHVPGAVNLWVLDDAERAEVGETYVRRAPFLARKRGAALVARNVAGWLDTALADKPASFRPLVYCWRGGMRSNAMATILSAVGWRVSVIGGGYKAWRSSVSTALGEAAPPWRFVLLDGQTGTAKTEILRAAAERGVQAIDLEALAEHRGSAFGGFAARPQPGQRLFESRLWAELAQFDRARPVLIEAESRLVGRRRIPDGVWRSMATAPRIEIRASVDARVGHLLEAYADIVADRDRIALALERLAAKHPKRRIEAWRTMNAQGAVCDLAAELITAHYDPLYERARRRRGDAPTAVLDLASLDAEAIAQTATRLAALAADADAAPTLAPSTRG